MSVSFSRFAGCVLTSLITEMGRTFLLTILVQLPTMNIVMRPMSHKAEATSLWRSLVSVPATCVYSGFGITSPLDTQSQNLKERGM